MTATLRRATPGDIDAICLLLNESMNPDFPVERWRKLFTHGWCNGVEDIGIVAEDDGTIVGFHGHIHSTRPVNGRKERFANFTSWYLRKEYRGQGLGRKMLEMATEDPAITYTVCSLSPKRIDFFKTLGMDVLDTERYIWRKDGHPYENLELVNDPEKMARYANPQECKVIQDHANTSAMPVLVFTRCSQCLLLLSISKKKDGIIYYDILYRSNPTLFSTRVADIAEALLPDGDVVLAADCRFLENIPVGTEKEPIPSPRFYKTENVEPKDVDLAYTEIVLLDLKLD